MLRSRKFWLAIVAAGVTFAQKMGLLADAHAADQITNVLMVLIGAIAIEDAGAKVSLPTPPAQQPKLPIALMVLAAWSMLAGGVYADPAPPVVFDLGTLQRGDTGRQNDAGVSWPGGFEVEGPIVAFRVRDRSNGRVYLTDPEAMAEGKIELHHYLLAAEGTIAGKKRAVKLAREAVRQRVREALVRAASQAAARLPAALAGAGPDIVSAVLAGLVRR